MIPQAILFWNAESIFRALHQDPAVSEKAALYLKTMSFALPSYAGFEVMRKWLQGQGRFFPATCIVCVVAPINVLLTYFLVLGPVAKLRFGFVGAPISTVISITLMFLFITIYSVFFLPKDAWGGWTKGAFHGLGNNIKLGAAGTLMIGSEWWCWEIVCLLFVPLDCLVDTMSFRSVWQLPISDQDNSQLNQSLASLLRCSTKSHMLFPPRQLSEWPT